MLNTISISHLTRIEKLQVMEALWEDLSGDQNQIQSPDWHQDVLQQTQQRLEAGQDTTVDWEQAKRKLRKRTG